MEAIKKLIKGKEIDMEELIGRANQTQIQKVREIWTGNFNNILSSHLCLIISYLQHLQWFHNFSITKYLARNWVYPPWKMLLHAGLLPGMHCEIENSCFS